MLAAIEAEFQTVQAAVAQEIEGGERAETAFVAALEAANTTRIDRLDAVPAAAVIQADFTAQRRTLLDAFEAEVAATLEWMRVELAKVGG